MQSGYLPASPGGLDGGNEPAKSRLRADWLLPGHADRRAPRAWAGSRNRDPDPAHLYARPIGALIMLSAIYYGAMYGGTITSVLINVPGEAASVITCIDGHQMAKQGRAGTALGIAAIGSFIGGVAATIALVLVAPPLASLALRFGPPEFFAVM